MRRSVWLLIGAGVVLGLPPRAYDQTPASASPLADAAKARQNAVKTADVEFKVKEIVSPGGVSAGLPPGVAPGKTVPEKETTVESSNRLVIDGSRFRYENNHPLWSPEQGKLLSVRLINVCDGETNKNLYTVGLNDPNIPEGFISRSPRSNDIKSSILVPLMFAIRGLEPSLTSYVATDLKATGSTLPINGVVCQEYILTASGEQVVKFWADPASDQAVRRYRRERQGRLVEQCDISYRRDESCGWLPASWVKNEFTPAGAVRIASNVEVVRWSCNTSPPDELFSIQFPPTAKVHDARTGKWYRVQADGTMREFSIATGEELTEVISQPGDSWFHRHAVALVAAGACLVLLALALVWGVKRKVSAAR